MDSSEPYTAPSPFAINEETRSSWPAFLAVSQGWLPAFGCALFLLAFGLYLHTALPTVGYIDAPIYTEKGWNLTLGFGSTDHPLAMVLLHWVQKLPFGNLAYKANLFSALSGAMAIGFLGFFLARWRLSWTVAAVASLAFALSHTFWWSATEMEVYTLTLLFLALILGLALEWSRNLSAVTMFWVWFLGAIGLWCHQMLGLWLGPLGLWMAVLAVQGREKHPLGPQVRSFLTALTVGLVPFGAYVFWTRRGLPLDEALAGATGGEFQRQFFAAASLSELPQVLRRFVFYFAIQYYLLHFGFLLFGAWVLYRERRKECVLLALLGLSTVLFVFGYHVPDRLYFYLPVFLLGVVPLAQGGQALLEWAGVKYRWRRVLILALLWYPLFDKPLQYQLAPDFMRWLLPKVQSQGLMVYLPTIPGRDNLTYYINPVKRDNWSAVHFAHLIQGLPENAYLIDDWYHGFALIQSYYQGVCRLREDVSILRWFVEYGGTEADQERVKEKAMEWASQGPLFVSSDEYPMSVFREKMAKEEGWDFEREGLAWKVGARE